MKKKKRSQSSSNFKQTLYYADMGTRMMVSIGIAVFAGIKADDWLRTSPAFTCVLPLVVLIIIFYKLLKQTKKTNGNQNSNDLS